MVYGLLMIIPCKMFSDMYENIASCIRNLTAILVVNKNSMKKLLCTLNLSIYWVDLVVELFVSLVYPH